MSTITVEQYSEKAIVVRGNTVPYKEKLLSIGGKWNKMLKGGEGWIFPLTKKPIVEKLLSEPPSVHNDDNNNDNEHSSKSYNYKKRNISSDPYSSEVVLTKKEYLHLISRIERLEQLVSKFDNSSQNDNDNNNNPPKIKKSKNKIPPPLSSISDSDICDLDYNEENEENEREPVQRLLRKKN